jgi:hypothetical protein
MTNSYDSLIKIFHILEWENGYNVSKMVLEIQESKPQKLNCFNLYTTNVENWASF